MRTEYTDVIARIPPRKVGVAELVHDTPCPFTRLRASMKGMALDREKYARLLVRGNVVMTDVEFERRTNSELLSKARGNVLIGGLGMGLVLDPIIAKCDSVTVVEKESDVIELIGPYFEKATIVHADIMEWLPEKGRKFETIYFDIWPNICGDDLDDAKILHSRFRKHLSKGGYMQSWCRLANYARGGR